MAMLDRRMPVEPTAAAPRASELRRLWDTGHQAECLRQALEHWQAVTTGPEDVHWLEGALRSSGLIVEAFALRLQMTRRNRGEARGWTSLVRSVWQSGDPWWARDLLREAGTATRELQALAIEVELALGDAAPAIAEWQRQHRDASGLESAVDWWVRSGAIEAAERLVAEVPGLQLWRARLALWRNDPAAAEAALREVPQSPAADCLRAIAALLRGGAAEAEAMLRPLLDGEARAEAWSWLATALRQQRRYAEAARAADTANAMSQQFNLALWSERTLASEYQHAAAGASQAEAWRRMRTVAQLEHAPMLQALGLQPEQSAGVLEELLQRFAGNHSPYITLNDHGRLIAHPSPPDAGQLGVSIQLVLRTRGLEAVRELYRELAPRAAGHPRFRLYQSEVELWMGEYAEAARIFRGILAQQRDVKWAWIGLGASTMLQGDLAEAQRIWAEGLTATGCAGPTLYVYRGECYRRQGELARARQDLEVAVREKPQRLSGWINLALLDGGGAELARVHRACAEAAPVLMSEVTGEPAAQLEQVLAAMRGNRGSSRVTYHLWGRVWHFMTRSLESPGRDDARPTA